MALRTTLGLLATAASTTAFVPFPLSALGQAPIAAAGKDLESVCKLPPVLSPDDDLPSAVEVFANDAAFKKQVKRHQDLVRVPSVCYDDLGEIGKDPRWEVFYKLHEVLEKSYPLVHKHAKLEKINTLGLVYTFQGSDDSLKPVLLAAHQDVVPVADASTWKHPPFSGLFDGEWLYGRGSSDDKNSLTGLMSAVESLLESDWKPTRTFILAFGFDEECSGFRGAKYIGEHLKKRYGENGLALVLDEGGLNIVDQDNALYALPAVMEKGHVDVWVEVHVTGGHSSVPFPHTGIGIISQIITTLESKPYEAKLGKDHPTFEHLQCQARYSPDADAKVTSLIKDDDLDGLTELLAGRYPTQYLIRTSQAVDIISGGQKINAMPEVTTAGVNYRVAPHDSIPKVQHTFVKNIQDIVDDFDFTVKAFEDDEAYLAYAAANPIDKVYKKDLPTKVEYNGTIVLSSGQTTDVTPKTPTKGPVWDVLSGTIQYTFQEEGKTVVPAPEIMTGNTDTRHYLKLTPNIFRWSPMRAGGSENIHTINERVRMKDHVQMVQFYYDFIRNSDAADFEGGQEDSIEELSDL